MRIIGSIPHPECKITLFSWNQKFLIKFELGLCEQTFKVPHEDVADEDDLRGRISPAFIESALLRFGQMHATLAELTH
jgi:hypothetical protein